MIPPAEAEYKKPLVLVVEDEEDMRQNLKELLSDEFRVLTAANAEQALRIYYNEQFRLNVVLLDIRLPDLSGLEVLFKMRNINLNPDVIMLTALSDTKTAVTAMRSGAYDYVNKPFYAADLIATVKRALEKKDYSRKLKELTDRLDHERIAAEHRQLLFHELQMKGRIEGRDLSAEEKTLFHFPVLSPEDYNFEKLKQKLEADLEAKVEDSKGEEILIVGSDNKEELKLENAKTASSAKEAFEMLAKDYFDLVLLSLNLPDADGMEALSRIRKEHPDIDVILIAAQEDLDTAISAMKKGAYDYITRPFISDDLLASIKRVFEKRTAKEVLKELIQKYREARLSFEPRLELFKQLFQRRKEEKKSITIQDFYTFFPELKTEVDGTRVRIELPAFSDEVKLEEFVRRMKERASKG